MTGADDGAARLADLATRLMRLARECQASRIPVTQSLGRALAADALAVVWALDQLPDDIAHRSPGTRAG